MEKCARIQDTFHFYCTQVRPLLAVYKHKSQGQQSCLSQLLVNCGQPPLQTTGSHKTEFVFDVRQFGVLQRARLHFSTPTFTQSS